jgi:hypothetical protein
MAMTAGAIVAFVAACGPAGGPTPPKTGADASTPAPGLAGRAFSSDIVLSNPDPRPGQPKTTNAKVFVSGQNMRWEMNDDDGNPVVMIVGPEAVFMIGTEGGKPQAVKLPGSGAFDEFISAIPGMDPDFMRGEPGATSVGACTAAGVAGALYRVEEPAEGSRPATRSDMCVAPQGFPLEVRENGQLVMQTTRFTTGPQDAALFAPPTGIPVQDLGAMMKDLAPAMTQEMEKALKELQSSK